MQKHVKQDWHVGYGSYVLFMKKKQEALTEKYAEM